MHKTLRSQFLEPSFPRTRESSFCCYPERGEGSGLKYEVDALVSKLKTLEISPFNASRQTVMDGESRGIEFFGGAHSTRLEWESGVPEALNSVADWFERAIQLLDSKFKQSAYG